MPKFFHITLVTTALLALSSCETPGQEHTDIGTCVDRASSGYDLSALQLQVGERSEQDSVTKAALGFALHGEPQPETHAIPRPVQPPIAAYPYCALEHAVEGQCTIYFDVSKTGLATDIQALCTHGIFVRDAERAVSRAKFSPATVNGEPVDFPGLAYPMVFKVTINTEEIRVER